MGAIIAVLNKKDKSAVKAAVAMLETLSSRRFEAYGIASPSIVKIEKTLDALKCCKIESNILIGQAFTKILNSDQPQPIRAKDATLVFDGRIYSPREEKSNTDAVITALQQQNRETIIRRIIMEKDGDFAFAMTESERLIAARDVMGVRPFYYGENTTFAALASQRSALWKIGIEKAHSFPPGSIAFINKNGFKLVPVKALSYAKPTKATIREGARKLEALLRLSIKKRLVGLDEVAVAFSGGLDSSVIAVLAKNLGVNVHLIHVSLERQQETEHAKKVAEKLAMPIHIYQFKEAEVEKVLQKVLRLVEEPNPQSISIGIPNYWAAEKAAEMNFKVILAGQGADELFGGYQRYINSYMLYGSERTQKMMFEDTCKMHEVNFERDSKICNFHNVELRLPFANYQIAKFAIKLPLELKIEPQKLQRKLVLREVAKNLGLPQFVAEKPKKAIQYATGVNKSLGKLARRKGMSLKEYLQDIFQVAMER